MRSNGYNTERKQMILEYLKSCDDKTVTVDEIFQYLISNDKAVNITTIYRYLDRLVAENKVMVFASDDRKKSSYKYIGEDFECNEHLHLQCTDCGKVIHFNCEFMNEIVKHISKQHDFDLKCSNSILYGKCKDCQK